MTWNVTSEPLPITVTGFVGVAARATPTAPVAASASAAITTPSAAMRPRRRRRAGEVVSIVGRAPFEFRVWNEPQPRGRGGWRAPGVASMPRFSPFSIEAMGNVYGPRITGSTENRPAVDIAR